MLNHGSNASEKGTGVQTPVVARSGIPFVVGTAPVHTAENPAEVGKPVLLTSWEEAVERFGYSEDWRKYTLCEFMYSHFKLYKHSPVIFVNAYDNTRTTEEVSSEIRYENHKLFLPIEAIDDFETFNSSGSGSVPTRGVDFDTYYDDEHLVVEMKTTSAAYNDTEASVKYKKIVMNAHETDIAMAFDAVDYCITRFGVTPDLLCAPFWSDYDTVAAVMATAATNISGIFKAKALNDIEDTTSLDATITAKDTYNIVDSEQIVCWPMLKLGGRKFHLSTQLAGLMAQVDTENGGVPCESPSNKVLKCDGLCDAEGNTIDISLPEANELNANGIVTAINFVDGFVAWGNYTACYPSNTDVKDYFIPISRSFKWVENTLIQTFWKKVDKPLNRVLIDSVVNSCNIWLNGLVGKGYFLGARVEVLESENSLTDLMAGKITFHVYITPPSPAQQIDWVVEYDASYVTSALS